MQSHVSLQDRGRGSLKQTHAEEKAMWRQRQRPQWCDHKLRRPGAHRNWKRQEDPSLEPPEGVWLCPRLDFGLFFNFHLEPHDCSSLGKSPASQNTKSPMVTKRVAEGASQFGSQLAWPPPLISTWVSVRDLGIYMPVSIISANFADTVCSEHCLVPATE